LRQDGLEVTADKSIIRLVADRYSNHPSWVLTPDSTYRRSAKGAAWAAFYASARNTYRFLYKELVQVLARLNTQSLVDSSTGVRCCSGQKVPLLSTRWLSGWSDGRGVVRV